MMPEWRRIRKIDSHVHILPKEVLDANPDSGDEFSYAREADLLRIMDGYCIEKAVIMTFNDPFLMSMDFSAQAEDIYEQYFDILDQMNLTEVEANQIAHGNITRLLWGTEQ